MGKQNKLKGQVVVSVLFLKRPLLLFHSRALIHLFGFYCHCHSSTLKSEEGGKDRGRDGGHRTDEGLENIHLPISKCHHAPACQFK